MTQAYAMNSHSNALPRRALVVEDEPLVLMHLSDVLNRMGFTVVGATTVAEALQLTPVSSFAVAFIDLGLPDRSGLELAHELRKQQLALPIVFASGYIAAQQNKDEADSVPMLLKPYDADAIAHVLSKLGVSPPVLG